MINDLSKRLRKRPLGLICLNHKSVERGLVAGILVIILIAGCASDSPPIPQIYANERMQEQYLWRSEAIPKNEKILYGIETRECITPWIVGFPPLFFKMFITEKAVYIVSYETGQVVESWNYKEKQIEANPVKFNNNSCVQITEYRRNGKKELYRYQTYWNRKSISKLINYLVEEAQSEED